MPGSSFGAVAVAVVFLIGQGKDKEPQDLVVRSLTMVNDQNEARARLLAQRHAEAPR